MSGKDPLIFIEHMLENIQDIRSFTKYVSKTEFSNNKEKINAVVRSLEIMGEAAKNLPINFKEKYSNVPWKKIIGTRDVIIHHYFGVNLEVIWEIVKNDLPKLKEQMLRIKKDQI